MIVSLFQLFAVQSPLTEHGGTKQWSSITLTLSQGWWGRCKKLSPKGGRRGG